MQEDHQEIRMPKQGKNKFCLRNYKIMQSYKKENNFYLTLNAPFI